MLPTLFTEAADIGIRVKHLFYDCMNRALAQRLDVPLVTANRPFFEQAKLIYESTYWLEDADTLVEERVDAGTND